MEHLQDSHLGLWLRAAWKDSVTTVLLITGNHPSGLPNWESRLEAADSWARWALPISCGSALLQLLGTGVRPATRGPDLPGSLSRPDLPGSTADCCSPGLTAEGLYAKGQG